MDDVLRLAMLRCAISCTKLSQRRRLVVRTVVFSLSIFLFPLSREWGIWRAGWLTRLGYLRRNLCNADQWRAGGGIGGRVKDRQEVVFCGSYVGCGYPDAMRVGAWLLALRKR